jgi:tetratricopeptide (TPR) repeat protein
MQTTYANLTTKAAILEKKKDSKGAEALRAQAMKIATEADINTLAYQRLAEKKNDEALALFRQNVKNHPDSWNCYDSLGEALATTGDKKGAAENYSKALALAPKLHIARFNRALAHRLQNLPAGEDAGDVTKPMLQDLCVNPQRQGIEAAHFDALPPMRRRVGIEKRAVQALQPQIVRTAKNLLGEQLLHEQVAAHPVRRRTEHRDELRITPRGGQHLPRLGEIHRHARLTKYVLPRLERRNGNGRMHVGRCADPDHVEIGHA